MKTKDEQSSQRNQPSEVFTPLGRGRIVYKLKNGTYVVEFSHGGGHIFTAKELFEGRVATTEGEVDYEVL